MKVCHHSDYFQPLPAGHPFPMSKYTLVHQYLLERGIIDRADVFTPDEVSFADLERVHTAEYLAALREDRLDVMARRRLGVPWSSRMLRRSRLAVQGTLTAARHALADGLAGNLAGGTHHAFAERGEGFCVLNDVAVAIRTLQAEGRIRRAVIIDLDVHQGNGTAAIFQDDADVYTFSMHGERNYPAQKMRSTRDVGLPDGTGDDAYLTALASNLPQVLHAARADLGFYLAGVDVAAGDRYGRFALTEPGVRERESQVIAALRSAGLPLAIVLAGGYAATAERTAQLHTLVFDAARSIWNARGAIHERQ